jgi:pimeloyl-ACP methyl ester carboxylesterase
MSAIRQQLLIETGSEDLLIFLPGFLCRPRNYTALLEPLGKAGLSILIPNLGKRWGAELSGRFTATDEGVLAAGLVTEHSGYGRRVWLAGHSRGGQVAWMTSEEVAPVGLMLIDPVDSDGRKIRPTATATAPRFDLQPLIIGAGLGGRCAPALVNHDAFAAKIAATHLVLPEAGHADILNDNSRLAGRRICPGGPKPDATRASVTSLMDLFMADKLNRESAGQLPTTVLWR